MVWIILIMSFLAVGVHLIIYSKKRRKMLKRFAKEKGMKYLPEDEGRLEDELNKRFALEEGGVARSFMKVKDIVVDKEFFLFRCTELLDLNPYGGPQSPHQNHICLSFDVPQEVNMFFMVDSNGHINNLYPKKKVIYEDKYYRVIKDIIQTHLHRSSITISFHRGGALLYTNPVITGGEKMEDLEYLMLLGRTIKGRLTDI